MPPAIVPVAGRQLGDREVERAVRVLRIGGGEFLEGGDGFLHPVLRLQRDAEVEQRLGMLGMMLEH